MSGHRHATVSAWTRSEEGGYTAEIAGWTLHVTFQPERPEKRRGFTWEAKKDDSTLRGDELHEEMEDAMAEAEARIEADHPKAS